MMTADQALSFIEEHGVVLLAARGPLPQLVEAIVGEPIRGSWWAHPHSHGIFAVLQQLEESADLLQCRLVAGKVTVVHRRLWPALFRLADRFAPQQLARIHQEHTPSGRHVSRSVEFAVWVPEPVRSEARSLDTREAERILGPILTYAEPAVAGKMAPGRPARHRQPTTR
jgi:hypothetical protein